MVIGTLIIKLLMYQMKVKGSRPKTHNHFVIEGDGTRLLPDCCFDLFIYVKRNFY